MKILFITNIKANSKAGLFLSVANRTSYIINNYDVKGRAISLVDNEISLLRLLKMIFHKNVNNINSESFIFNKIKFEYIYNNINLVNSILSKIIYEYKFKKYLNTLIKKIDISSFDLIQAHWAYPIGFLAKIIKDKYELPYILTVHGSDIHTNLLKNGKIKKCTLVALENADSVIFVSKKLLDIAKGFGYSGVNAEIIPNGIDINIFNILNKEKIKKELELDDCKVVGFVGNLVEIKRAEKLPEIFGYLKEIYGKVEFLVIGEGVLKQDIINKCKEKNLKVKFTGMIDPQEVPYYLNAMDVMILPSRNEGWPCVVLEANACGVPVVGSNNGGIPEAIGEYGIVVDEGENFELRFARAIASSLACKYDLNALRKRALQYDWSKISLKEYEVYKNIIK